MCETSQRYHNHRRRSDSLTLTIFQWTLGNRSPEKGSSQALQFGMSNSDMSPPPSPVRIKSIRIPSELSPEYAQQRELFRGRSISGSSLDSMSRSIATQTPTEDLHFVFPDLTQNSDDGRERDCFDFSSPGEELNRSFESDPLGVPSTPPLRRHSMTALTLPSASALGGNVPRTNAMQIPVPTRRTLKHSISYSFGVKESSSVGQELRNIGDDFDRIRVRGRSSLTSLVTLVSSLGDRE